MGMWIKVRVFSLTLLFVLTLLISPTIQIQAQDSGLLDFQLMHEDPTFDSTPLEKDLNKLWMSGTQDHLYFLVQFANVSYENPVSTNVTVAKQNDPNEKYLISATYFNNSYTLYIAHSSSLTGDAVIPDGDSYLVQYVEKRIFYFDGRAEIGFFIDWVDIGGNSAIDLVVWSNRSVYPNYDKLPDATSLSFTGVEQNDRQIDFVAALNGDFSSLEFDDEILSTISTEPTITTTSGEEIITSEGPTSGIPTFLVFIYIIILFTFLGLWISRRSNKPAKQTDGSKKVLKTDPILSSRNQSPREEIEMKFIPELGREVRMCCYQTSRLDETYCWCGRAVSDDLRNVFKSDT